MNEQEHMPALPAQEVPSKPRNAFDLSYRVPFAPQAERPAPFHSKSKKSLSAEERTAKVLAHRWLSPYCRPGKL